MLFSFVLLAEFRVWSFEHTCVARDIDNSNSDLNGRSNYTFYNIVPTRLSKNTVTVYSTLTLQPPPNRSTVNHGGKHQKSRTALVAAPILQYPFGPRFLLSCLLLECDPLKI